MKKIFKQIGGYFIRLYRAIFNLQDPETIILSREEEFYSFLEKNKERIQYLMQFNNKPSEKLDKLKDKFISEDKKKRFVFFRPIKISKNLTNILNKESKLKSEQSKLLEKNYHISTGNIVSDDVLDTLNNINTKK